MRVVQWNQVFLWWDVCCKDRCLTLCVAVLHVQRHQGVSGRAVRGSRGKQLNVSSHSSAMASSLRILGYIYCNCVLGFARGCWACVCWDHCTPPPRHCQAMVWCERRARPSVLSPALSARECFQSLWGQLCWALLPCRSTAVNSALANGTEAFPGVCGQNAVGSHFVLFTAMPPFLLCLSDV